MNCSLENLHKSLKIRIFGYGSEQRTANIAYNKQYCLSIKNPFWGNIFLRNGFFMCKKLNGRILA